MDLNKNDIISILKACKKLSVSHIKIDGIEVSFKTETNPHEEVFVAPVIKNEQKILEIEQEILNEEDFARDVDRLAASDVEDPEKYEELVLHGLINQEGNY